MKWLKTTALLIMAVAIIMTALYLTLPGEKSKTIILATTTSTYDTGLLDAILPDFTTQTGIEINVISVGTGQAITIAEQGDADVILIHAPTSEQQFMDEGYGLSRECVMYNDFVILGPSNDPAGIRGLAMTEALESLLKKETPFISRGDDSGTDKKEKELWKEAGLAPTGSWYREIGQGMGDTIRMSEEEQAYTLSDRGTYLALKDQVTLEVLVEGDDELLNQYGVITVKSSEQPQEAQQFATWLMSPQTQESIDAFRKSGEQLFHALRGECILG